MRHLTVVQEYLICAVNGKGELGTLNTEKVVCLVAGGLLELQMEGCVRLEGKRVEVIGALPDKEAHLAPLYDYINQAKPMKLENIITDYTYSFIDKRMRELVESIGASLAAEGLAEVGKAGMFGSAKSYHPKKEALEGVINEVRAELLEDVELTDDVALLTILLERGKCLKEYFSKYEQKALKEKVKALCASPSGRIIKEMIGYVDSMINMMTVIMMALS